MQTPWEHRFAHRTEGMKSSFIRELLKVTDQPDMISFGGGFPAAEIFPIDRVRAACDKVLTEKGRKALQYTTTEGYAPLREWVARDAKKMGINISLDNILITTGSQQALDFVGRIFINRGDRVLTESPTYLGAIQAWNAYGPHYVTVDTDEDGIAEHLDNCVTVANVDQLDMDGDARGDACDMYPDDPSRIGDDDGDGVDEFVDNCPGLANADQLNTDGDAQGNVCDADDDNDGDSDTQELAQGTDPLDAVSNSSSWPVISRAWTILFLEWPPSRPRSRLNSASFSLSEKGLVSNFTPRLISSLILAGPFFTTSVAASLSVRPHPASIVSLICSSKESSRSKTDAIPPWACRVLLSLIFFFVIMATFPCSAALRA